MKLRLIVVGKGAAELAAYEERFAKRIRPFAGFEVVELPEGRAKQPEQRKQQEAKSILDSVNGDFVLFDERGKSLTSRDFAAFLEKLPGNACQDFVIGGASGVHDSVRQRASRTWSLSAMTLPHQLVRAFVVEQSYRAFSILQGHPYHRD